MLTFAFLFFSFLRSDTETDILADYVLLFVSQDEGLADIQTNLERELQEFLTPGELQLPLDAFIFFLAESDADRSLRHDTGVCRPGPPRLPTQIVPTWRAIPTSQSGVATDGARSADSPHWRREQKALVSGGCRIRRRWGTRPAGPGTAHKAAQEGSREERRSVGESSRPRSRRSEPEQSASWSPSYSAGLWGKGRAAAGFRPQTGERAFAATSYRPGSPIIPCRGTADVLRGNATAAKGQTLSRFQEQGVLQSRRFLPVRSW